jgi:hypothetical protein
VCRYCTGVLTLANLPKLIAEVRRDFGPKRIWLTEYGYATNPPDPNGVSWPRQAQYLAEAAWRVESAPLVDMLIQFMLNDESRTNGWHSGLVSSTGDLKPAFNSFMLPIVQAARKGLRTTLWGQVRPGSGRREYQLQRLNAGGWRAVGPPALTDALGSYTRVVGAPKGSRFRAKVLPSGITSRPIVVH